ncbi:MAG TPA: HRDC domain-containing protein [Turneriella sp.]|nr:HRDC domain-containing protein [Turneriella sp.]
MSNGHETLSTYGIGRELEKTEWLALARQLVQQGLLRQDAEYGTLALAPPAIPLLKGEMKFFGRATPPPSPPLIKGRGAEGGEGSVKNTELFEILRRKRKELADEQNLAPYMIFSDKSLIDMSTRLPQSRAEFLDVHGVGEAKWQRYGEQFLYLIREFAGNR